MEKLNEEKLKLEEEKEYLEKRRTSIGNLIINNQLQRKYEYFKPHFLKYNY